MQTLRGCKEHQKNDKISLAQYYMTIVGLLKQIQAHK